MNTRTNTEKLDQKMKQLTKDIVSGKYSRDSSRYRKLLKKLLFFNLLQWENKLMTEKMELEKSEMELQESRREADAGLLNDVDRTEREEWKDEVRDLKPETDKFLGRSNQSVPVKVRCSECGKFVQQHMPFCPYCGASRNNT